MCGTCQNHFLDLHPHAGKLREFGHCGLPERHINVVTLENINAEGKDGCIIINADHVRMSNVSVRLIGED